MSNHAEPILATHVLPLRHQAPIQRNWASMGLPDHGWVMIKDRGLCPECHDGGAGSCINACISDHALPTEQRLAMGTCAQCDPAPCQEVCPTNAITRSSQGVVLVDQELCNGCRFCADVCDNDAMLFVDPYRTATPDFPLAGYTCDRPTGLLPNTVAKCTFCTDRLMAGQMPVCAEACPVNAIWVGNLDRDTVTNGHQLLRLSELLGQRSFEPMGPGNRMLELL